MRKQPGTHYFLILFFLLFSCYAVRAQTPAENLQSGIEIYNKLREYQNDLNSKTITTEQVEEVRSRSAKGTALLDMVIRDGSEEEAKVARYFKTNFKYVYGYSLGMKGENQQSYNLLREIEPEMTAYSASGFPIRYTFFGKNFVIKWDNFAFTQVEYFTGMGEMAFNTNRHEDALRFIRLALAHPDISNWLKYIGIHKLLDIQAKNKTLVPAEEYLDLAGQSVKIYDLLSDTEKKTAEEYEFPKVLRGVNILTANAGDKNDAPAIARFVEAAPIAAKYEPKNAKVLKLFQLCYTGDPAGDAGFHKTAQAYAQTNFLLDHTLAEKTGVAATDRLAGLMSTADCAGLQEIAGMYAYWKRGTQEAEFRKKAETCLAEQEKARKKAEKAARKAYRNFNFYVGANILPLINTNEKRDYGGVVDFVFRHSAIEFSYIKINRNKENIFDLWISDVEGADQDNISRWDGFKAFVQPKFFNKSDKGGYLGIILGYNEKSFDPITVNVTSGADGSIRPETFEPRVKQYVGMLNLGFMKLYKGFGMDFFFGLGANYSMFDAGNPLDRQAYTIDNPLLENRKDHYFGVVMRTGITLGLNFGPGND